MEDTHEMPDLPVFQDGVALIKCGLDPDEARNAATKCFVGTQLDTSSIDEALAEILEKIFGKMLSPSLRLSLIQRNNEP